MKQIGKKVIRHEAFRGAKKREIEEARQKPRLEEHHYISPSRNTPIQLFNFVCANPNDPAKKAGLFHFLSFPGILT